VNRVPDADGGGACQAAEGCDANGDRGEDGAANDDREEGRASRSLPEPTVNQPQAKARCRQPRDADGGVDRRAW
jgi:hypothetical protein